MMNVYFSNEYVAPTSSMETVNKALWISDRMNKEGFNLVKPTPLTREELYDTHSKAYVDSLFDLNYPYEAEVGGKWSKNLLESIKYSNGGIRDAVISAHMNRVSGSLSAGLHHAGVDYGAGFCQVNGLVMGALMAKELGYKVGILDVDAHCGGGTHDILSNKKTDIMIADISTNTFDDYIVKDRNYNLTVVKQKDHPIYLKEVKKQLDVLRNKGCNFIMVNAGMDPTLDNLSFATLKEREELIAKYIHDHDMKAVWVLAGGYLSARVNVTKESLTDLHMATFYAFNNLFNKESK